MSYNEINIKGKKTKIGVDNADMKQIQVNDSLYVVPGAVARLIGELSEEIRRMQTARVADDRMLDGRINKRVGRIARTLEAKGYLREALDTVTALPAGWESDVDHIFLYDVTDAIKQGLKGSDPDLNESLFNTVKLDY